MQPALYGKLPARRDFISIAPPRRFLALWEPWLQEGMAASRATFGDRWAEVFCQAPIWRFWLGPALCGTALLGATMPSMDAVGRCFPLTLVVPSHDAVALNGTYDRWFVAVEDLLLKALDPDTTLTATTAALARLPPPAAGDAASGAVYHRLNDHAPPASLASLFRDRAGGSLWWTIGGDIFAPSAASFDQMPPPDTFAQFLQAEARCRPAAADAIEEVTIP